jgi:predicted PurR-regulated permease PerM
MLSILVATPNMTSQRLGVDSTIIERLSEFTLEVRRYVGIMTMINLLVAAGNTVLLLVLGVDFALLWGILSFFLGYIPSVGFWLALIPPVLLAWAEQGVATAVIVFVAYVLINGAVQNIMQPRIMGRGLRLSPLVVFVSVVVWTALLGGLGALIAVPMTLIVQKVLAQFDSTRWIADLMSLGAENETSGTPQALERLKGLAGKAAAAVSATASQG